MFVSADTDLRRLMFLGNSLDKDCDLFSTQSHLHNKEKENLNIFNILSYRYTNHTV